MKLRTAAEARAELQAKGISITQWAIANHYSLELGFRGTRRPQEMRARPSPRNRHQAGHRRRHLRQPSPSPATSCRVRSAMVTRNEPVRACNSASFNQISRGIEYRISEGAGNAQRRHSSFCLTQFSPPRPACRLRPAMEFTHRCSRLHSCRNAAGLCLASTETIKADLYNSLIEARRL